MSEFFVYTNASGHEQLQNEKQKVILVGGDFGFPNFGDILQLKGTIEFHQSTTGLVPIPVYSLDAIANDQFIAFMQQYLGVGAILFISDRAVDVAAISMVQVREVKCVRSLQLYGGGFLNDKWGGYVLAVVEHFLQAGPNAGYIVSGQQIGAEFRESLTAHLNKFKPALFGVRDLDSLELLNRWGVTGCYSFDDAYESLLGLAAQVPAYRSNRVIGHLNFSSYTNERSSERLEHVLRIFARLRADFPRHKLTLLNAYNDKRFAVCDSLRSVVVAENDFPYKSYSVLDLVMAAYSGSIDAPELMSAELAVSCSYHVTMLLHLSGIPCWLVAQNSFYEQKARALNGETTFEQFISHPQIPDYAERITARAVWVDNLTRYFNEYTGPAVDLEFKSPVDSTSGVPFRFKATGIEDMQEGIRWLEAQTANKDSYIADLVSSRDSLARQMDHKDSYISDLLTGKEWLEAQLKSKDAYVSQLLSDNERLKDLSQKNGAYIADLLAAKKQLDNQIAGLRTVSGWVKARVKRNGNL